RGDRAVLGAHLPVQFGGPGLEPGPVQAEGGGAVARHVVPRAHRTTSCAVVAITCWTRVTSTRLTDSRSRASQPTRGTEGSRSRAVRIWSRVWGLPKSLWATTKGVPCASSRSMEYQESSRRRASTSTTAPTAPAHSRAH